jgi:lipid A 3-O-deacylase
MWRPFCGIHYFERWKGSALIRILRILLLVLMAGAWCGAGVEAQESGAGTPDSEQRSFSIELPRGDGPVTLSRISSRGFNYGPFVNGGMGLGNRDNFGFLSAGVQGGKILTPVIGHGFLAGQFEYGANIMPLWLGFTPAPNPAANFLYPNGTSFTGPEGGGTYVGVSITPVVFRWDFATHSKRVQPWFQAAGGLIWTNHKYPPDLQVPHGTPGGTSVWNFTPQGGGGIHYFLRPGRSIDVGVNAVHISSASLGDRNPGVNASIQVQVGYTFWR